MKFDDLTLEQLTAIYKILKWFNKLPKPTKKEVLKKLSEKIEEKR